MHGRFHSIREAWRRIVSPKLDLPFAADDFNRSLPWLLGAMVFLAGVVLALSLSLRDAAHDWRARTSDQLTVQLPSDATAIQIEQALGVLSVAPGIADARRVPQAEVARLVEPWLGEVDSDLLPMPALIDARIADRAKADLDTIGRMLDKTAPGARVQGHEAWMQTFAGFLAGLQQGAYSLVALILSITTLMVILAARTGMQLHRDTVELLHLMGARDGYLARQFQRNLLALTVKGAGLGAVAAAAVYAIVGAFSGDLAAVNLPRLAFTPWHAVLFATLMLGVVLLAQSTARLTALALLRKMF